MLCAFPPAPIHRAPLFSHATIAWFSFCKNREEPRRVAPPGAVFSYKHRVVGDAARAGCLPSYDDDTKQPHNLSPCPCLPRPPRLFLPPHSSPAARPAAWRLRLRHGTTHAVSAHRFPPMRQFRFFSKQKTKSRLPKGSGSLAFPSGFEPLTFRLGVDSEPPNCSKIGNFLANRALLCVFFVYFALFFMFQASIFISFSNFYAKIYAKTMLF